MKQQVLYKYLGTNGTILSPIHLEDTYYVRYIKLTANKGYKLTQDNEHFIDDTIVPEEEIENWIEVKDPGQD